MIFSWSLSCWPASFASASAASDKDPTSWWKQGVVYQVYPRSFLDGCSQVCTGTGSLRGIEKKLTYLRENLGVDIIWISPIYDSQDERFWLRYQQLYLSMAHLWQCRGCAPTCCFRQKYWSTRAVGPRVQQITLQINIHGS